MVSDERQISHNLLACALNASIRNTAGARQQLRAYAPIFSRIALHIEATFLPRRDPGGDIMIAGKVDTFCHHRWWPRPDQPETLKH